MSLHFAPFRIEPFFSTLNDRELAAQVAFQARADWFPAAVVLEAATGRSVAEPTL